MISAFMNHNPDAVIEGALVAEMIPPGEEVILA
jgi:hypothetical protein